MPWEEPEELLERKEVPYTTVHLIAKDFDEFLSSLKKMPKMTEAEIKRSLPMSQNKKITIIAVIATLLTLCIVSVIVMYFLVA